MPRNRLVQLFSLIVGALAGVPWQASRKGTAYDAFYEDLPPNVFAPDGRLRSVEQILPLSYTDDPSCTLAIAFLTKEGIVVVTTLPKSPYLFDVAHNSTINNNSTLSNATKFSSLLLTQERYNDSSSNLVFDPPFAYLAPNLLSITAGNSIDSQLLRLMLQNMAESSRASLSLLSARSIARKLADQLQQRTQEAGKGRLLAASVVLMDAQELWKVEPTGQLYQCQVAVAGRAAPQIEADLLKALVKTEDDGEKGSSVSRQELHATIMELSIQECLGLVTETIASRLAGSDTAIHLTALSTTKGRNERPSKLTRYSDADLHSLISARAEPIETQS